MVGRIVTLLVASMVGCAHAPRVLNPNELAVAAEPWDTAKATWYFENCEMVKAMEVGWPREAWLYDANHALTLPYSYGGSANLASLMFRCERRPPWRRSDLARVRDRISQLKAGAWSPNALGFECEESLSNQYEADEIDNVAVIKEGTGEAIRRDAFIRARVRATGVLVTDDIKLHHGRFLEPDGSAKPNAADITTLKAGTIHPIKELSVEWVRHGSCWSSCLFEAMSKTRLGGRVEVTCGTLISEIEAIEQGGVTLYEKQFGL